MNANKIIKKGKKYFKGSSYNTKDGFSYSWTTTKSDALKMTIETAVRKAVAVNGRIVSI